MKTLTRPLRTDLCNDRCNHVNPGNGNGGGGGGTASVAVVAAAAASASAATRGGPPPAAPNVIPMNRDDFHQSNCTQNRES